jgi:hypothetical protein
MLERDDTVSDVNLSNSGIDDMIKMGNLSEETILKNLKLRYTKDLIYVIIASFRTKDLEHVIIFHLSSLINQSIIFFFWSSPDQHRLHPSIAQPLPGAPHIQPGSGA